MYKSHKKENSKTKLMYELNSHFVNLDYSSLKKRKERIKEKKSK